MENKPQEDVPCQGQQSCPGEAQGHPCGFPPMGGPHHGRHGFPGKPFRCTATIGEPAPFFAGSVWEAGAFKDIKLTDYQGKWLVFFFYPMDFTFVCPTEICAFSDASDNYAKYNVSILGASCDSKYVHREFALRERKQGGVGPLKIPWLADPSHDISKSYGCYINKGENKGVTYRATYIIDPKGIVRHISMNDLSVGRNVDEILRLTQALQFHDENGDVCPTNWKPGRKTMKPKPGDPELTKFFQDELGKEKK